MPGPMPTKAEIEACLLDARAELIAAEDHEDPIAAKIARMRCDQLLEQWAVIPAQRQP